MRDTGQPPNFDPRPDFPETRAILANLHAALLASKPSRVEQGAVTLSCSALANQAMNHKASSYDEQAVMLLAGSVRA